MSWVRIDDQAPRHHKMLKAGPAACWLWVCGIAHCQSQLTDGFISNEVLPMIGIQGVMRCKRLAETLVDAGLFDLVTGGYMVHDYLAMNPSKVAVLRKRAEDAERKRRAESERNPSGIHPESGAPRARVPSHPIRSVPNQEKNGADARSKRPIFSGQRLTVFEWQLDECLNNLGSHADAFALDEWFWKLDALAVKQGLVIPKRDGGEWLQAQLLAECQRRGIPLRMASAADVDTGAYEAELRRSTVEMAKRLGIDPEVALGGTK